MFIKKIIPILLFVLVGCTTPGSFNLTHTDPTPIVNSNEKYVNTDSETVWNNLVKELSKTFFVINNIDKESRIMNVSFYTDNVCDYADCGKTKIHVKKSSVNKTGLSFYNYSTCSKNSYIIESTHRSGPYQIPAPSVIKVKRKPSIEGRMNIYVAPQGNGTLVTVNCRYILTIKVSSYSTFHAPAGNIVGTNNDSNIYTCSFNTLRVGICDDSIDYICQSTGQLEKEILNIIK